MDYRLSRFVVRNIDIDFQKDSSYSVGLVDRYRERSSPAPLLVYNVGVAYAWTLEPF